MSKEQNIPGESHEPQALSNEQNEVNENLELAQTKNMEVHAHHLHKAPGKKFWHYFFEFFMLFLAVSAGFFVENLREHYIEHKRAKVFARLLSDDPATDIAELNRADRMLNQIIIA